MLSMKITWKNETHTVAEWMDVRARWYNPYVVYMRVWVIMLAVMAVVILGAMILTGVQDGW